MNIQTPPISSGPIPGLSTLPDHRLYFQHLIGSLEDAVGEDLPLPVSAPDFDRYADNQCLLQQCVLGQHFSILLKSDSLDYRAATNLRHTLALIERTRARLEKKKPTKQAGPDQPERDDARHFLQSELSRGERPATELLQIARSIGIAPATLRRAKSSLNIVSTLRYPPDSPRCWMWSKYSRTPRTG